MSFDVREQLCKLRYGELAALSVRLFDLADVCRNPPAAEDIRQAARAVSDLASTRYGIEEIVADCKSVGCVLKFFRLIGKEP